MLTALLFLAGCATAPSSNSSSPKVSPPHLPASPFGVRISRTGEAVTEINLPQDLVYDTCENVLRKKLKVTFVNRPRIIEAEKRSQSFSLTFTTLTSGKTAFSVTAQKAGGNPDYQAALDLANELALELKSVSKPIGVPFRTKDPTTRDE